MKLPGAGVSRLLTVSTSWLLLFSTAALAGPSIDVSLHTSFPSPPFILELLETAAAENSTSYFPLLNSVASGRFSDVATEQQLYEKFAKLLQDQAVLSADALASWKYAVALHETAPRIEAQYQFWNTSVRGTAGDVLREPKFLAVEVWKDSALCADIGCTQRHEPSGATALQRTHHSFHPLDFDRIYGEWNDRDGYTVYIDPTHKAFGPLYLSWQKHFIDADVPFRLRYKPAHTATKQTLFVSGYGVEISLKKTDYIVIDDRDAQKDGEEEEEAAPANDEAGEGITLDTEAVTNLKPLSSSELKNLGLKMADFIMNSNDPFSTLQMVMQDLPKHAAALSSHNYTKDFIREHRLNREILLPPGFNVLWINGMQVADRDVDPYTLLDTLRRERQIAKSLQDLGFAPAQAVELLTHDAISGARGEGEAQRYEFRDASEGGNVIVWLNDIEKDKRYKDWPDSNAAVLQRTFPGQPPQLRRDLHNLVWPVDFTDFKSVSTVVENLQLFVKKLIAIRFGLVPMTTSQAQVDHARVVYHLQETYGISLVMAFLRESLTQNKLSTPSKDIFDSVIADQKLRQDRVAMSFGEVVASADLEQRVLNSKAYLNRLGADGPEPPFFGNGVAIPRTEDWMSAFSQRISVDLALVQRAVFENELEQDAWLPSVFMKNASISRNPLIIPDDDDDISHVDLAWLYKAHGQEIEEAVEAFGDIGQTSNIQAQLWLLTDLTDPSNSDVILNAILFAVNNVDVQLSIIHNNARSKDDKSTQKEAISKCLESIQMPSFDLDESEQTRVTAYLHAVTTKAEKSSSNFITSNLGLASDRTSILLNGRLIELPSKTKSFSVDDFNLLLKYETERRIIPITSAVEKIGMSQQIDTAAKLAQVCSMLALSSQSDVPPGIFEMPQTPRMSEFDKWNSKYTCINIGDKEGSSVQIVASIDPASELGQRWVPILAVLSQLDGLSLRIFLNPKAKLESLPVTRFYRQVLSHEPHFQLDGSLQTPRASFKGLPEETLLTTNMDVPPSWLVAPKESVHDLDNIKLTSTKSAQAIEATYEIESILIEGHSRDVTLGRTPRGAQLVLQTDAGENSADTIVMANVGYFQFKANPGVYNLVLQPGRSEEIFKVDSVGSAKGGRENTTFASEISLISFKGATLFPRLSRMPGKELEDVLEEPQNKVVQLASKGAEVAGKVFSKLGFSSSKTQKFFAQELGYVQKVLSSGGVGGLTENKQADINIFSVASGHLYERMLNIMMVSVMRHTKHTVKFWFIEQFLSPSFKTFLPIMAEEYGFDYEMVAYKWPHWLRAQTEKQRIIWGYKILFLDVLFPLDLDKVIFVDADQIVRTDMYELVTHDLQDAPYGFTPMCDDRVEMEGFRFWKQGYWKNYLRGLPYHISALYVVDLKKFRQIAAGDRLRQQYHQLSADPNSLSNLDQDLPNHMQMVLPIHSLPQEWLWCETWCSDESLQRARTIDLCNNPLTKEPKLDRARRQVPEWTEYDDEIAALARRRSGAAGQAHVGVENPGEAQQPAEGGDAAVPPVKKPVPHGKEEL